jgi:hypothetical protein
MKLHAQHVMLVDSDIQHPLTVAHGKVVCLHERLLQSALHDGHD